MCVTHEDNNQAHGESLEVVDNTHIQRLIREARHLFERWWTQGGLSWSDMVDFNGKWSWFMVEAN